MSEVCSECGEECETVWGLLAHNHAHHHIRRMRALAEEDV